MIRFNSSLPHIYIISVERYIYIGETQVFPPVRWGQHFSNGSFVKNLQNQGVNLSEIEKDVYLQCFPCVGLANIPTPLWKSAAQEIEAHLHRKVICSRALFDWVLISNTVRTEPRESIFELAEESAIGLVDMIEESMRTAALI